MTWFKVDDKPSRPPLRPTPPRRQRWAYGARWFMVSRQPHRWIHTRSCAQPLGHQDRRRQTPVEVGLWTPTERKGERGWQFHEWTERQPSRADIERVAETKGMAGAQETTPAGTNAKASAPRLSMVPRGNRGKEVIANASHLRQRWESPTRPDPTRPDPTRLLVLTVVCLLEIQITQIQIV